MTIATTARTASYNGNDGTVTFAVPFQFRTASDLRVISVAADGAETVKTLTSDYTVSGGGSPPDTGSVTMQAPPASGTRLVIEGAMTVRQPREWEAGDRFPAAATEGSADDLAIFNQEARRDINDLLVRAITLPRGETVDRLPLASDRTSTGVPKLLGFDTATGAVKMLDGGDFKGDPGAAGNVAGDLGQLQAASPDNVTMLFNGAPYLWTEGDFTAENAVLPTVYVEQQDVPINQGAWVQLNVNQLNTRDGLAVSGWLGTGFRPNGTFMMANRLDVTSPLIENHTILSMLNYHAWEETAWESVGILSNGAVQQQGAIFWRWWRSINHYLTRETVNAIHMVYGGQDNTPAVYMGRNSVILCPGDTALLPWEWNPPGNFVWVYTKQKIGTSLFIGADADRWDTDVENDYFLEIQGNAQFGEVIGGAFGRAMQLGYSTAGAGTGFLQSFDNNGNWLPLAVNASDLRLAPEPGMKIGLFGAAPITRPPVNMTLSTVTIADTTAGLGALAIALRDLGAINLIAA